MAIQAVSIVAKRIAVTTESRMVVRTLPNSDVIGAPSPAMLYTLLY
jgi:hypothetical protein